MILLEPFGCNEAVDRHFYSVREMTFEKWQLDRFTSGAPALRSFIYQDVVNQRVSFSTTGMYAGILFIYAMGNEGHLSTCGNRHVVVKRN